MNTQTLVALKTQHATLKGQHQTNETQSKIKHLEAQIERLEAQDRAEEDTLAGADSSHQANARGPRKRTRTKRGSVEIGQTQKAPE